MKAFLRKHLSQMQTCFCITHFQVSINVGDTPHLMEIIVDYEYLEASIVYGKAIKKLWKKEKKDKVLQCLAHEVAHILTGEVKMSKKNFCKTYHDERATEHISRLLYRLYAKEYSL